METPGTHGNGDNDWRGAALVRVRGVSRICYATSVAERCVKQAAPGNYPQRRFHLAIPSTSLVGACAIELPSPVTIRGSRLFKTI